MEIKLYYYRTNQIIKQHAILIWQPALKRIFLELIANKICTRKCDSSLNLLSAAQVDKIQTGVNFDSILTLQTVFRML